MQFCIHFQRALLGDSCLCGVAALMVEQRPVSWPPSGGWFEAVSPLPPAGFLLRQTRGYFLLEGNTFSATAGLCVVPLSLLNLPNVIRIADSRRLGLRLHSSCSAFIPSLCRISLQQRIIARCIPSFVQASRLVVEVWDQAQY